MRRRAADPIGHLGEGEAQRTVDDRLGIAEPVRCARDHLRDGLKCVVRQGHTLTRRDRLPPMIFAWSSTGRCSSAFA